jgi:hypothetical protein
MPGPDLYGRVEALDRESRRYADVDDGDSGWSSATRRTSSVAAASTSKTPVFGTYRPPEFEALKRIDERRWHRGKPNLLDELGASRALDTLDGNFDAPAL